MAVIKNRSPEDLEGIELMIFDLQDVGARFYTYISTLHYVMEACAENNIPLLLLDRPNPNGAYVDGPVLDTAFTILCGHASHSGGLRTDHWRTGRNDKWGGMAQARGPV